MRNKKPTAARLRGDIDSGKTGDKAPGLDPSAAPMETDAEAGGAAPGAEEVSSAREQDRRDIKGEHNAAAAKKAPHGG